MAVTVGSYNSSNFANDLTNAPTLTGVAAAIGDVIRVAYMYRANEGAVITPAPTWNGESFSAVSGGDLAIATDALRCQVFELQVASTGTFDIVASNAQFKATCAGYVVFAGTDETTPFGTLQSQVKFDTDWSAPSLDITGAAANDLVFEILATTDWDGGFTSTGATWSPANSQTELFDINSTGHVSQPGLIMAYKAGTGSSQTLGYTPSTGQPGFIHIAFAVKASGAAPPDPEFTAGPSVSSITSSGFTAGGTANVDCTARLIVTNAGASQPSGGTFDASSETASVTAATPFTIPHAGEAGNALRWAWIQLDDGVSRVTSYAPALLPAAGWEMVLLTSVNPDPALRITAVPDLEAGHYVQWGNIQGTGTVVVNADASHEESSTVTAFDAAGGNLTDGWGAVGTQSFEADETAPTLTTATIGAAGTSLTLTFNEAVSIGAGGSGGFGISLSGGAATLTYDSGDGSAELIYTISRTIYRNETGTLAYVQPGSGIEDAAGNDLASFSGASVANNSTQNHAPTDIALSRAKVSAGAGVNATVGTLSATDADPGDAFTYSLVAGTGDTNNADFNISGDLLRCDDPGALGIGDYSVRVQVSDGAAIFAKAFSIAVDDPATGKSQSSMVSRCFRAVATPIYSIVGVDAEQQRKKRA